MPAYDSFYPEDYFEPEKQPAKIIPIKKDWRDRLIEFVQKIWKKIF